MNREAIEVLRFNADFCDPEFEDAINLAISALKKQEKIIEFIESRKQLHSSPAWYEFGIVKELDEVKRYIEKIQAEEEA